MKAKNADFINKNEEVDSGLVKAIGAIESFYYHCIPISGINFFKDDETIVVYPSNHESTLCCNRYSEMKNYKNHPKFTSFDLNEFSYKFLHKNPFENKK
jgi:hypothetical protein